MSGDDDDSEYVDGDPDERRSIMVNCVRNDVGDADCALKMHDGERGRTTIICA